MNTRKLPVLALAAAVLAIVLPAMGQVQNRSKMLATKHNLTTSGPGPVRATSEDQLCIFCHTPHVPKQSAAEQLWNHRMSSADYTLYSSDYLTDRNYAAPSQPKLRSKLCLSCHDGTVAVGAVYNNREGSTSIEMENGLTILPSDAPSNLGTSLANDHPVGYIYDTNHDPELIARSWPWGTPIKLDPDAAGGTVECITCHDPHDDANGQFLRTANANAQICTFCHSKTAWPQSIHATSSQEYTPPGKSQTSVGEWGCRDCHKSHGGKGLPYLLNEVEEQTCFETACHGNTSTGVLTKNIEAEFSKLYRHPVTDVTGKHRNPDIQSTLNEPNRHSECPDCHNPHQAQKGLHAIGNNLVSGVLKGVNGITPVLTPAWMQPTGYSAITPAIAEYQICLKCHSSYAFGQAPNGVTMITGPSGVAATDQAMEFNPANASAHPVEFPLSAQSGSAVPQQLDVTQLSGVWNQPGNQTMYCGDCHGNDQQTSAIAPQGPHGSNSRFMLTGPAKLWPLNSSGTLWSLSDIAANTGNWQNDLFCVNCHPMTSGGLFLNNVHAESNHHGKSVKCITCHVVVPHGAPHARLIGYDTDPAPYNYNGAGTLDRLVITKFVKAPGPNGYQLANCTMNGVCHSPAPGLRIHR